MRCHRIPTLRGGAARWKRLAVSGWELRETAAEQGCSALPEALIDWVACVAGETDTFNVCSALSKRLGRSRGRS